MAPGGAEPDGDGARLFSSMETPGGAGGFNMFTVPEIAILGGEAVYDHETFA
jgi:hypothetical protein